MKKIYVVIPNWNGADMIQACLASLRNQKIDTNVVVVDNGSIDNSIELITQKFPSVHVIRLAKNHGFAGGVNVGIKFALKNGAQAVALLNNDAVVDDNWLISMAATMDSDENIGIVAPKILKDDKIHIDSTGDTYSAWGTAFPRGRGLKDTKQFDKNLNIFAASGGASLYRTKLFKEIGLFDEDFFAYYEDGDISFRARLAGWNIVYEPKAIVYHKIGGTSSKLHNFSTYHGLKNIFFLSYKNLPLWLLLKYLPRRFAYYTALHIRAWVYGKPTASLKAVFMILVLLPKKTRERHKIQKNRELSSSQIDSMIYHQLPPSTKRKLQKR